MSPQEPQTRDEIIRLWGISEFRPEVMSKDRDVAVRRLRCAARHFALDLRQNYPRLVECMGANSFDRLAGWILEAEGVREPPPPVR